MGNAPNFLSSRGIQLPPRLRPPGRVTKAAGACPPGKGLPPTVSLDIKIRKLAKNLVYFGLYCRGLWGNRTVIFHVLCPGVLTKISLCNFGVHPRKILSRKTFSFATLQLYHKLSSIRKRHCKLLCVYRNCHKTRCTLVNKRQKIRPKLRRTQRAAITLGFATHSSCF